MIQDDALEVLRILEEQVGRDQMGGYVGNGRRTCRCGTRRMFDEFLAIGVECVTSITKDIDFQDINVTV